MASSTDTGESSSLLVSIFQTLMASIDSTQRERERKNLEIAFKEVNESLNKQIGHHYVDLTKIVQAFSAISANLSNARSRIQRVNKSLRTCRELLHCRRDDLRRLWLEDVHSTAAIALLDKVHALCEVRERLKAVEATRQYLLAAFLIREAFSLLATDLAGCAALNELHSELVAKIDALHEGVLRELFIVAFSKPVEIVFVQHFSRVASERRSKNNSLDYGTNEARPVPNSMEQTEVVCVTTELFELLEDWDYSMLPRIKEVELDETVKNALQTIGSLIFTKRQRSETLASVDGANTAPQQSNDWSSQMLLDTFGSIELRRYPIVYIRSLVDCLYDTNKLVPTLSRLFESLNAELPKLLIRCNAHVAKSAQAAGESLPLSTQTHTVKYLVELVEVALRMCNYVAFILKILLDRFDELGRADPRLAESLGMFNRNRPADAISYKTVWNKVQDAIIALLRDYLDADNLEMSSVPFSGSDATTPPLAGGTSSGADLLELSGRHDINEAFKPPGFRQRILGPSTGTTASRNKTLFLFSHSEQHAVMYDTSGNSVSQKRNAAGTQSDLMSSVSLSGMRDSRLIPREQLVCRPRMENLTSVYATLNKYVRLVEISTAEKPCELKRWLNDLVQQVYMMNVQSRLLGTLNAFARSLDFLQVLSDPKQHAELRIDKPQILYFVVVLQKQLKMLEEQLLALTDHKDQLVMIYYKVIHEFKDTFQRLFQEIAEFDSSHPIISAVWVVDHEFRPALTNLSNWKLLSEFRGGDSISGSKSTPNLNSSNAMSNSTGGTSPTSLTPIDPQQNALEFGLLQAQIGLRAVDESGILKGFAHFRSLALIHESLDWFLANHLDRFLGTLERYVSSSGEHADSLAAATFLSQFGNLRALRRDYQQLVDSCLLVIHVELRLHLFHYIVPALRVTKNGYAVSSLDVEADPLVQNCAKDLLGIAEQLKLTLTVPKLRYAFDGLGYTAARLFMDQLINIEKISETGIKKMCRNILCIQQALNSILYERDTELDNARQLYELLYLTPEQVINQIMEHGRKFSDEQYSAVFSLYHKCHPGYGLETLQEIKKRLRDVLYEQHV